MSPPPKRPVVFLLGAGASVPLGMPTTIQLRRRLCDDTADGRLAAEIHRSAASRMRIGEDAINIELFLEHVYELQLMIWIARRCDLPKLLPKFTGPGSQAMKNADAALARVVERAFRLLHETCGDCDGSAAYRLWRPILDVVARAQAVAPIFTLNYDWTFEKLAIEQKPRYDLADGFELLGGKWSAERLSRIKPHSPKLTLGLFKLHGSTNWLPNLTKSLGRFEPSEDEPSGAAFQMIYPASRYERDLGDEYWHQPDPYAPPSWLDEEPYKTLYAQFGRWTKRAGLIVIIGYAFGDRHVNEKLAQAMNEPSGPKVLVIDPGRDGAAETDLWAPPFGALKMSEMDWKWSQVHWLRGRFGTPEVTKTLIDVVLNPKVLRHDRTGSRRRAAGPPKVQVRS